MYIFVDLDDTLLNKEGKISDYSLEVIKLAQSLGHKVCFNTARSLAGTKEFLDLITPDYQILNGGNQIIDSNLNIIYEAKIDKILSLELIKYLKENNATVLVECGKGFITDDREYAYKKNYHYLADFNDLEDNILKIVYKSDDTSLLEYLKNNYNLDISNYVGGPFNKISKYNKANGNKILKTIKNDKIIAFGDDLGDIEMLLDADVAICMKNSRKDLFNYDFIISDYSSDEDGVAKYLKEHILGKEGH